MAGSLRRFNVLHDPLTDENGHPGYRWHGVRGIGNRLGAELIGASVYELADGERTWPYHMHHGVEEWVLVLAGTPTVRLPEGERTLAAGDTLCLPEGPDGAHGISGPGRILILSANRPDTMLEYPDSGKVGAGRDLYFRRRDAVDYWDGE